MVISSKNIIAKICVFALVFIVLPGSIYYFFLKNDSTSAKGSDSLLNELPEFTAQLKKRWQYGDIEESWGTKKFKCTDIPNKPDFVGHEFLRCNANYLKCYFQNHIKTLKTKNFSFRPDLTSFKKITGGDLVIKFMEEKTKTPLSVRLEHNCHDVYLPTGVYSASPDPQSEYIWDNYGQQIFIDKTYVTYWDLYYFSGKAISNNKKFYEPVTNFSKTQMNNYCASLGKRVLASHILDAVSFYPSTYEDGHMYKSFYPWGKSRKKISDEQASEDNCKKLFTKECFEKFKQLGNQTSPTPGWSGVFNTLGGVSEYVPNVFNSEANLKVSHKKLSRKSLWHRIGLRSFWNGSSEEQKIRTEYNSGKILEEVDIGEVGFRCMRLK